MKINIRTMIKDLKGENISNGGTGPAPPAGWPPLTYGDVFQQVLLSASYPQGSSYTPEQSVARYVLAIAVEKAKSPDQDGEIEVSAEMAAILKVDVARSYGPIVAGQILPALDGK